MITILDYELKYPMSPHAIFSRPLHYFTVRIRPSEDELDEYNGASFAIGNYITFDLRTYRRHAKFTVTLYLPDAIINPNEVLAAIKLIMTEMKIPESAVAWQRGDQIIWGKVEKRTDDRLREAEARILALKIAALCPNKTATTYYIKNEIPKYTEFSPVDLTPSPSRKGEPLWRQIVGNVFSHEKSKDGPFERGYAERTSDGLTVTPRGIDYLKSIGFL